MKRYTSLLIAPLLLLTTACSSHYSASSHSHARGHNSHHDRHAHSRHHSSRVSIGVNSHHRGGGKLLGALIVGGLIGHALTEASHDHDDHSHQHQRQDSDSSDELVNGYKMNSTVQPERQAEQNRFYEIGSDGNCYLMEKKNSGSEIVAAVPSYSCQ